MKTTRCEVLAACGRARREIPLERLKKLGMVATPFSNLRKVLAPAHRWSQNCRILVDRGGIPVRPSDDSQASGELSIVFLTSFLRFNASSPFVQDTGFPLCLQIGDRFNVMVIFRCQLACCGHLCYFVHRHKALLSLVRREFCNLQNTDNYTALKVAPFLIYDATLRCSIGVTQ